MLKTYKKSLWICLAGLSLGAVACKNFNKNNNGKTAYASAGSNDANDIVAYNNAVVKITDGNNTYLKSVGNNLQAMEKDLQNPNADRFLYYPTPPIFIRPYTDNVNPEKPPKAMSSSDRKFFQDSVAALNDNFKKIKDTYKSLQDYFKAQDYKDDKGVKGLALIDSIYALGKKYYSAESAVLDKLDIIADDAERVTLRDNPLRDYVYALKDDSNGIAGFIKLIEENAENYTAAETKIKASYDSLAALNQKHTAMSSPDETQYPGKKSSFARFNSNVNDFLIEARKIMRDASATGKVSESDISSLKSQQDYVRDSYNGFVD